MKQASTLFSLVGLAVLTGCQTTPRTAQAQEADQAGPCADRVVTVLYIQIPQTVIFQAVPNTVEVRAGCSFTVSLVPPVENSGDARTQYVPQVPVVVPAPNWLNRSNEATNEIVITVPAGAVPEGQSVETFKYSVTIAGRGTLDPIVRVSR